MAVEVTRRWAQREDVDELIANLREADRQELLAGDGDPAAAVVRSVRDSTWALALRVDGKLACIFGVAPLDGLLGRRGSPWMLGTPVIDRNPRVLIDMSPAYLDTMLGQYPHLINRVDARNRRSIRWLKWLGFTLHPAQMFPGHTHPFHLFEMRK